MSTFSEGEWVALHQDNALLGLAAGTIGTVWALYDTQPPAYEATFTAPDGAQFDALMYEAELTEPDIVSLYPVGAAGQARLGAK